MFWMSSWFVAVVGGAQFAIAQATWIVDVENRPGAHHADLQAAFDAASPGDLLLLRPSNRAYGPLMAIGKGVTVLGLDPAPILPYLNVIGLPASDRMVVANFHVSWLFFRDCSGPVFLDRTTASWWDPGGANHCRLLAVSHSRLPPEFVVDTTTAFFSHTKSLPKLYPLGYGQRRDTLFARDGEVHLVDSYCEGSTSRDSTLPSCTYTTSGFVTHNCTATASRSTFVGGAAISYQPGGLCQSQVSCGVRGNPMPTLDASVVISNGTPGCGPPPPEYVPTLSWERFAIDGLVVTLQAEPNAMAILCESLPVTTPTRLAIGDLWLDPATLLVVSVGTVGPNGERKETVPVDPGLRPGTVTALQSLILGSSGFTLSKPAFAVEP